MRRARFSHALTLVECLLASVVLAMSAAALSQAIVAGQHQSHHGLHQARGLALAEAMLEEILAKPYRDPDDQSTTPGPESGESSRADLDNADDYHGLAESAGTLEDVTGTRYSAAFGQFTRMVTAVHENHNVTGLTAPIPGLRVTVTVTDSRGQQWRLTRFIHEPPA